MSREIQLSSLSATEDARRLGRVRCDRIHQRGRQAVIGLELQFLESRSDGAHVCGIGAGFNDRGNKGGEFWRRPALVGRKFGVNKIEAKERMLFILNASVH